MLASVPPCTRGTLKTLHQVQETEQVFQFSIGLHDSNSLIRSQIMAMDPLPTASKVYSILHQEEKQRLLHLPTPNSDAIALSVNRNFGSNRSTESKGRGVDTLNVIIVGLLDIGSICVTVG